MMDSNEYFQKSIDEILKILEVLSEAMSKTYTANLLVYEQLKVHKEIIVNLSESLENEQKISSSLVGELNLMKEVMRIYGNRIEQLELGKLL